MKVRAKKKRGGDDVDEGWGNEDTWTRGLQRFSGFWLGWVGGRGGVGVPF